jgi:protein SCO1/2
VAAAVLLPTTACAGTGQPEPPAGVVVARTASTGALHAQVLDEPYRKPALTFTETSGRTFRLDTDTRSVALVFFGYTHCPDACAAVLADVAAAFRGLDAGTRQQVQLVFVTTDPARDDPATLRAYLDRFDPTFVGLTAPLPVVEQAAAGLGVALTGRRDVPGGYEIGHGTQLVGFGPDGLARLIWPAGTPVADLRADVARLASTS